MPIQSITAQTGIAKQASKGTISANPTFAHGLMSGTPVTVEPTQSALEVTSGKRVSWNVIRESVAVGGSISAPAYLKSVGLYLLGALGSVTTTGAGPYTHTYATGDLPYLSLFAKGIGSTIEGVRDCKIDELTLKWDGSKPVTMDAKFAGTVFSYPASFTPTTDETGSESFLTPVGGTFQYDLIGGSAVSARIVAGEIMIKNNVTPSDPSASVEADDVFEGLQEHSVKLTVIPDDISDFRKAITGSGTGTSVSSTVPVGSINIVLKENAGSGTLTITGSKIAFLTAFPDADPKGGAIQIDIVGTAVMPSGGTAPLVFALSNAQASY